MEEGKKKIIMIGIIMACIVAAIVITVATQSGSSEGGIDSIKRGEMIWIKCRNPKCEEAWQMDKRDYFEYIEKYRIGMTVPAIACSKCGDKEGYRAEKCEKCGNIFERGAVSGDLADRCPKCRYSAQEELRKQVGGVKQPATTETPATPATPAAPATSEQK
jgi:ribosomal protein L40E